MLLANARSHSRVLRLLAPDRRLQLDYVRFALAPPPEFMRWQLGDNNSAPLAAQYAYRPIRFVGNRILQFRRRPTESPDISP